jgi:hypothetical protein
MSSQRQKHINIADAAICLYTKRLTQIKRMKYLMNNSYRIIKRLCKGVDTTVGYCVGLLTDESIPGDTGIRLWQTIDEKIIKNRKGCMKEYLKPIDCDSDMPIY